MKAAPTIFKSLRFAAVFKAGKHSVNSLASSPHLYILVSARLLPLYVLLYDDPANFRTVGRPAQSSGTSGSRSHRCSPANGAMVRPAAQGLRDSRIVTLDHLNGFQA
ncbi:hypothetical protein PWR63_30885 [Paraburkholderia sp. A2WS-5]|uniref:hypothetical protein n=1 Tax=unclassified Paraburkholderia TaxID=2615204 RepID=UPI003B7F1309